MGKYGKTMSESYREVLEWTANAHELHEKKKVSKREIDKLEDGNEHGMVALKLAQSFGTPKEVKTVQDINKRHNRAGSIEHKDQKERDAIIRKYYDMAEEKLDEKLIGAAPQSVLWGIKDGQFGGRLKRYYPILQKMHDKELKTHAMNNFSKYGGDRTAYIKDLISRGIDGPLGKAAQQELEKIIKDVSTKPKKEEVELDEMNPTDHVKKKGDKYCVYNADGSVAKEFDNEEDANKYAIDNHDSLMNEETELDEAQKDIEFARTALTKANIKHVAKQHPMKRSKIIVNVSRKDYKAAEKALGKEFSSQGDNIMLGILESTDLDEKYDLYHKTFSDAMKHAVDYAKSKMGITVDPKEIDDKVATGPKKPSDGKTNKYRLKGKGGTLQIQVYNKGGSKPFELNMYKEEVELDEDAMIIDLDYSKNPKGLYNAVLQMSKRLGLTIYNAPQAMKDLQTKGKVRLGGKGANLVKFMKHLNDKGIEPSVDVQKGKMQEKKLTDAEMKKREEIAKAIEKDDPDMPMDKKMAIATATAKKVAEEEEPDKPDTAKKVDQMRDDNKKTRIAQLQLQIAKATETINKLNTQEK